MGLAFGPDDIKNGLSPAIQTLRDAGHDAIAQLLEGVQKEEAIIVSDLKTLVDYLRSELLDPVQATLNKLVTQTNRLDKAKLTMSAVQIPAITWILELGPTNEDQTP